MTSYIGIGGTAKKIKNIYIGVGGVAKQIKTAYIGVNSIAKQWYSSTPPTLTELFANMTVDDYQSSQSGYIRVTGNASANVWYLFLLCGTQSAIYRISSDNNGSYTVINKDSSSALTLSILGGGAIAMLDESGYYGCLGLAVRFPSFSDTTVRSLLSTMTYTKLAGYNSSTKSSLRTAYSNINATSIYMAGFSNITSDPNYFNGISFSLGSTYTSPIYAIAEDEELEHPNYAFLYKSGSYVYLSPSGTSTSSVIRCGSIHRFTLS